MMPSLWGQVSGDEGGEGLVTGEENGFGDRGREGLLTFGGTGR